MSNESNFFAEQAQVWNPPAGSDTGTERALTGTGLNSASERFSREVADSSVARKPGNLSSAGSAPEAACERTQGFPGLSLYDSSKPVADAADQARNRPANSMKPAPEASDYANNRPANTMKPVPETAGYENNRKADKIISGAEPKAGSGPSQEYDKTNTLKGNGQIKIDASLQTDKTNELKGTQATKTDKVNDKTNDLKANTPLKADKPTDKTNELKSNEAIKTARENDKTNDLNANTPLKTDKPTDKTNELKSNETIKTDKTNDKTNELLKDAPKSNGSNLPSGDSNDTARPLSFTNNTNHGLHAMTISSNRRR